MQNTVDDFWRMIWEQQAKVILMLTHLVENGLVSLPTLTKLNILINGICRRSALIICRNPKF